MPIPVKEIIDACQLVAEHEKLTSCLKEVAKGGAWCGGMYIVGGLVAGPPGALAGGALGSLVGYWNSKDYKPLHQIIQEMDDEDKARLANHMKEIFKKIDVKTVAALTALVASPGSAGYNEIVEALRSYQV